MLVRRHGIYIWGATWMQVGGWVGGWMERRRRKCYDWLDGCMRWGFVLSTTHPPTHHHPKQAKTQAECYHYLFKLAVEMHRLGIDYAATPTSNKRSLAELEKEATDISQNGNGFGCCSGGGGGEGEGAGHTHTRALSGSGGKEWVDGKDVKHVLMDIEGTTTSISFVHDTLFPYAKEAVEAHLRAQLALGPPGSQEVVEDIAALVQQAEEDAKAGLKGVPLISSKTMVPEVVANVQWNMAQDRKTTALKQLQGHIWRAGYEAGKIRSHVYPDVPGALERWAKGGKKLAIYSSGSREAQRLLFGYTAQAGDLRPYLNCYFDTTVGGKREAASYKEIVLSLGVDRPSEILFLTDIIEEAIAARQAGLHVLLSVRPGNAPLDPILSAGSGLASITSFDQVDAYLNGSKAFPR